MKCRQCGSEIADKALVCYRCGAATSEPKFQAPGPRQRRSSLRLVTGVLAVVLLGLCAVYLAQASAGSSSPAVRWLIVVLAAAIIAVRLLGRRSRG
jgi:hypothetical protein